MMESREALAGLNAFTAVAGAALPEREAHAPVFDAAEILLDAMTRRMTSPIGGRSMCAGKRACWRRWASASIFRAAPPPARSTI